MENNDSYIKNGIKTLMDFYFKTRQENKPSVVAKKEQYKGGLSRLLQKGLSEMVLTQIDYRSLYPWEEMEKRYLDYLIASGRVEIIECNAADHIDITADYIELDFVRHE